MTADSKTPRCDEFEAHQLNGSGVIDYALLRNRAMKFARSLETRLRQAESERERRVKAEQEVEALRGWEKMAAHWKMLYEVADNRAETAERQLAAARAELDELKHWLDNNTTFYDVTPDTGGAACTSGPNIPVLASVSKRIWYHATDDQKNYPFSAVALAAIRSLRDKQ